MPIEHAGLAGFRLRHLAVASLWCFCSAFPWTLFVWLAWAIASHRWAGGELFLSVAVTLAGAARGGWLVARWAHRREDLRWGDQLAEVEDAPPWALFPHPVQILKRAHTARCRLRWGVTQKSSGWTLLRRSSRLDLFRALGCLILVLHSWWL